MAKQWTLISQTVTDHITVPKTATNVNITRLLNNANADWTSIAKIVNKYEIKGKGATHNSVTQRILDIKNGKITELSQITGKQSSSTSSATQTSSTDNASTDTSTSGGTVVGSGGLNSTVSKVPIKDPVEAMNFAKTEWNKIRRTSGHTLECQVFGSNHWRVGEWCKVYIPSLNEYVDMYITKTDHSNDSGSEWLTNLTLMDYAPQLSSVEEDQLKDATTSNGDGTADGTNANGGDGSSNPNEWTQIASILQTYYEKPSGGWNSIIQKIREAKVYDPDIRSQITSLTKKKGQELKSYVDVGHELCKVKGIDY